MIGPHLDAGAAANRRSTPFEFVDRQVNPLPKEEAEGFLHSLCPDQLFQVAVFTPGQVQQLPIGTGRLPIDSALGESQKVNLARLQAAAYDRSGLLQGDLVVQEHRQLPQKLGPNHRICQRQR